MTSYHLADMAEKILSTQDDASTDLFDDFGTMTNKSLLDEISALSNATERIS